MRQNLADFPAHTDKDIETETDIYTDMDTETDTDKDKSVDKDKGMDKDMDMHGHGTCTRTWTVIISTNKLRDKASSTLRLVLQTYCHLTKGATNLHHH
jgi:hypothetical protein